MTRVGKIRAVLGADSNYGKLYSKTKNGTKTYIKKVFGEQSLTIVPKSGPTTRLEATKSVYGKYVNTNTIYRYDNNGTTQRIITNISGSEPITNTKTIERYLSNPAQGINRYSSITFNKDANTNKILRIHSRINLDRFMEANKVTGFDNNTRVIKEKIKIKYHDKNHETIRFIDYNDKNWSKIIKFFNFLRKLDMR